MTNYDKQTPNTPKGKLPRAAERAQYVWVAHRDNDPSLDARGAALATVNERFGATRSANHNQQAHAKETRRERDEAVARLQDTKQRWLVSLRRDLPGLDTSGVVDSKVPEDAVAQSIQLRDRVEGHLRDGETLAYAERCFADLVADERRVEEAVAAFYEADTLAQQARNAHHAAAVDLDDELVAFRAAVRKVLGSRHADYRRLRVRATRAELEAELDELVPEHAPQANQVDTPERSSQVPANGAG